MRELVPLVVLLSLACGGLDSSVSGPVGVYAPLELVAEPAPVPEAAPAPEAPEIRGASAAPAPVTERAAPVADAAPAPASTGSAPMSRPSGASGAAPVEAEADLLSEPETTASSRPTVQEKVEEAEDLFEDLDGPVKLERPSIKIGTTGVDVTIGKKKK